MALQKINITDNQNAETNVNWYADGEDADQLVLNRPIKEIAEIINSNIDLTITKDDISLGSQVAKDLPTNANDISVTDFFRVVDNNVSNIPTDGTIGSTLMHVNHSDQFAQQLFFYTNGLVATRTKFEGVWGSWTKIYNELNLPVEQLTKSDLSEVVTSDTQFQVNTRYHIVNTGTFTLPNLSQVNTGDKVRLTKNFTATPTIQVDGSNEEQIAVSRNNEQLFDTSVLFDINAEIVIIFNGSTWEV